MQSVTCAMTGAQLKWDDTLAPGELVTAYDAGYHIVLTIKPREGTTPLVSHRKVLTADGEKANSSRTYHCDASYVRRCSRARIEAEWSEAVEAAHNKRDNLLKFATR